MSKGYSGLFSGTMGERNALIDEVKMRGGKISSEDIVGIVKDSEGNIVWLEKGHLGNKPSGLAHILTEHEIDFNNIDVYTSEIPNFILTAVAKGKIVGYQGKGTDRPIYEVKYKGKNYRVAITVGSNGYIVGANPRKEN